VSFREVSQRDAGTRDGVGTFAASAQRSNDAAGPPIVPPAAPRPTAKPKRPKT